MTHHSLAFRKVWRVGANIDTDALAPGAYMKHGIEVIAAHCLEVHRPDFAAGVTSGDVLVAGPNFGIGSSREQAADALKKIGHCSGHSTFLQRTLFQKCLQFGLVVADLP